MIKFDEKIELIQPRSLEAIKKFELNQETVQTIMDSFDNQCLQYKGMDYLGDWSTQNAALVSRAKLISKVCEGYLEGG